MGIESAQCTHPELCANCVTIATLPQCWNTLFANRSVYVASFMHVFIYHSNLTIYLLSAPSSPYLTLRSAAPAVKPVLNCKSDAPVKTPTLPDRRMCCQPTKCGSTQAIDRSQRLFLVPTSTPLCLRTRVVNLRIQRAAVRYDGGV